MKQADKIEAVTMAASVLIICLFGYTAIAKILDYGTYVSQMKSAPVPYMSLFAPIIGWLIPLIEVIIVLLLLFDKTRVKGLYGSLVLLIAFEIYISSMLLSGRSLPCTCGGFIATMGWKTHLIFNAVFIVISVIAIIYKNIPHNKYSSHQSAGIDM
ncbi:MauE/DoxX family redox-associated membrane protein [Pedobacter sp. WC2423]|uniref:MauE/DoxX family redox-associated membrane protein n=1 Tax=Pedobacter sp. WC2423 TaxID=3234142 RepID=UPI003465BD0F